MATTRQNTGIKPRDKTKNNRRNSAKKYGSKLPAPKLDNSHNQWQSIVEKIT